MELRNRFTRPSKRTTLIAAILFITIISASLVGSTFTPNEEPETYSRDTLVPDSRYKSSTKVTAEEIAAIVDTAKTADAAKATTGFALWDLVSSAGSEVEGEDIVEPGDVFFERMVIFTADLELEVEDVDSTVEAISLYALEVGGFVSRVSTSKGGGGIVSIRVPQDEFYDVIQEVERLGEVKGRQVKGEDVTEDYVDLESRLRNLQNQEERLLGILDMAINVEEVLNIESELERVRGQIERKTGEIKYIEGRVELATITVSLNKPPEEETTNLFPEVDWGAPVKAGLRTLFTIAQGMITMAIVVGPFAAVGLPAYHIYKRSNKKKVE
ncbi:MAG: DUF4349 domain-containing protein [Candidatus Bathyarchaeota archaeon]|jgi:hypothetical protein